MINTETAKTSHVTVPTADAWYSIGFEYDVNPATGEPELSVKLDGEELTYMDDYIVGVSGVQLTSAPEANQTLVISRNVPFTQEIDFQTGLIDPEQIEHGFDRSVMRDQEIKDSIADAVATALAASSEAQEAAETAAGYEDRMQAVETGKVSKSGDVMSGPLSFSNTTGAGGVYGYTNGVVFFRTEGGGRVQLAAMSNEVFMPYQTNAISLGAGNHRWKDVTAGVAYLGRLVTPKINNGYDIAVPVTSGPQTFALRSEIDAAANSGIMLSEKGVWYAKMESATTPPAEAEVEGRNYADFSQVDGDNNPIIVIYEYTSGAWAATDTITPPADADGYILVTKKIWDIPEQTGQQGGRVVWNHTNSTFTPFPSIVSFDSVNITNAAYQGSATLSGTSTVTMPVGAGDSQIVNKAYVDATVAGSAFDLFDIKWRDATLTRAGWALSDGNWIDDAPTAYQHLVDDFAELGESAWNAIIVNVGNWWRYSIADKADEAHPYAFADEEYNLVYCDTETPAVGVDDMYDNYTSAGTSLGTLTGGGDYDTVYWPSYETIAGTTIKYFRAADGHKIIDLGYYNEGKDAADAVLAATGIAWYYILDTDNQRFILPRTKHAFVGSRSTVGTYVEPSVPNIKATVTGVLFVNAQQTATGAAKLTNKVNNNLDNTSGTGDTRANIVVDASTYNSAYKNDAEVQTAATEMLLYFFVGV